MTIKDIYNTIHSEVKIYFIAPICESQQKKIPVFCRKLRDLNFKEQDIQKYIEFTFIRLKKVKDRHKKSSVAFFVGMILSDFNFKAYLDFRNLNEKTEVRTIVSENENDDNILKYEGINLKKVKAGNGFDIFMSKIKGKVRIIIRDNNNIIPRVMELKDYVIENPGKIKKEDILDLIKKRK